jgi:O-antigen ligase
MQANGQKKSALLRTREPFSFYVSRYLFLAGLFFVTFEEIRPAAGAMLSDYLFGLSILFLPRSRWSRIPWAAKVSALLGPTLIIVGAASSLHSPGSLSAGFPALLKLFILFGLIAPLALCHASDINRNMFAVALGIAANCFITVIQAAMFPGIVDLLSVNPPRMDVGFSGRYQGMTEFPVTLGLAAGFGVLLAIGLSSMKKNASLRLLLGVSVVVCTAAALLSGSRTFFAALVPSLILFAFFEKQRRRTIIAAMIGLVFAWGAIDYVAPQVVSRYTDRVNSEGLIDYGRLALIAQIVVEISEKPILGWGVDHAEEGGLLFFPKTGEIAPAHNTFLRYWYAAGLLSAIGFLALFVIPVRRIIRFLKENPSDKRIVMVRLILACYLFLFIVCNLGPYLYNRYIFVPMFVLAGFMAQLQPSAVPQTARASAMRLASPNAPAMS